MHEMALMGDILQIVTEDARERGLQAIQEIALLVGEYSNAMPDALEMAFLIYKAEGVSSLLPDSRLQIVREAGQAQCVLCGAVYTPERKLSICPSCGMPSGRLIAGEAFQVISYEGS
ncbi:hydrogenase maturation nickel metallochaperone HypA/HybF [Ectobacillus ponti]|uniref:Hydrogenase maturation factor HypA n=1 Tax=Ectobacillus ponti TaxID=2961894 RepID=A0AA42BQX7_9BACI|nr:hydrogenase maturation nickel metallochaperone HypA [Ectobacillus ponti]MCP8970362.1 hydrogenase maturation nickel metallochaperone HypA [Ectobacillus ponti]